MNSPDVLVIEDTPSLQLVYASVLRNAGHEVRTASTLEEGSREFRSRQPAAVLLDLMLPDGDGLDLLREMVAAQPHTNVIVVTANGSINRAVEAMRAGAYEFLVKPFDESRMLGAIQNAIETTRTAASSRRKPGAGSVPSKGSEFAGFVGSSNQMQQVYARIRSVAGSMATVFVTAESGTGKEVCAQAVHNVSSRSRGPFVPLNCGAIPSELLESEVFGHLRGSFTGAISDKIGAAAAADGGTLFLDEVCEMPLALQTKLLRFLQTSTIQPVGAARPSKVNVRIICATNRDPLDEVRRGRFREDLFYRLHVIPIHLPPLRERGDDVIEIARSLLARQADEENKTFVGLDPRVEALFRSLRWPGNIRQLQNALRHVVVLHDGPYVTLEMLPDALVASRRAEDGSSFGATQRMHANGSAQDTVNSLLSPLSHSEANPSLLDLAGKTLAEIERIAIEASISRNAGSLPKAARELGVSPSTLYRKRDAWAEAEAEAADLLPRSTAQPRA